MILASGPVGFASYLSVLCSWGLVSSGGLGGGVGQRVLILCALGRWAGGIIARVGIPFGLQSCPEIGDKHSFREKCPGRLWGLGRMLRGAWGGLTLHSGAAFAQGSPCLYGAIFVFSIALREEVCCLRTSQLF